MTAAPEFHRGTAAEKRSQSLHTDCGVNLKTVGSHGEAGCSPDSESLLSHSLLTEIKGFINIKGDSPNLQNQSSSMGPLSRALLGTSFLEETVRQTTRHSKKSN